MHESEGNTLVGRIKELEQKRTHLASTRDDEGS